MGGHRGSGTPCTRLDDKNPPCRTDCNAARTVEPRRDDVNRDCWGSGCNSHQRKDGKGPRDAQWRGQFRGCRRGGESEFNRSAIFECHQSSFVDVNKCDVGTALGRSAPALVGIRHYYRPVACSRARAVACHSGATKNSAGGGGVTPRRSTETRLPSIRRRLLKPATAPLRTPPGPMTLA